MATGVNISPPQQVVRDTDRDQRVQLFYFCGKREWRATLECHS
jgi:hypothetical protein